jgi:hypothetical protein
MIFMGCKRTLSTSRIIHVGIFVAVLSGSIARAETCAMTDYDVVMSGQRFCLPDRYFKAYSLTSTAEQNRTIHFSTDSERAEYFRDNRPVKISRISIDTPNIPILNEYPLSLIDGMNVYWEATSSPLAERIERSKNDYQYDFTLARHSNPKLTQIEFDDSFSENNGVKSPKAISEIPAYFIWSSELAIWYKLACQDAANFNDEQSLTVANKVHYYSGIGLDCVAYHIPVEQGVDVRFQFIRKRIPISQFPLLYGNILKFLNAFRSTDQ